MSIKVTVLAMAFAGFAQQAHAAAPGSVFTDSRQLVVVTTAAGDAISGQLQRYARASASDSWRAVGEPVPIVVGRNGLAWGEGLLPGGSATTKKREGDGKSPEGVFALGTAFGYAASALPGTKLPYLPLTSRIECVDDRASRHYNRIVARDAVTFDWSSSERMREAGEAYEWGVVVDHNHIAAPAAGPAPVAGAGSCIFLHVWAGAGVGTSGCTAMARPEIESLLTWLDPASRPLLVQLTQVNYGRLRDAWKLP